MRERDRERVTVRNGTREKKGGRQRERQIDRQIEREKKWYNKNLFLTYFRNIEMKIKMMMK